VGVQIVGGALLTASLLAEVALPTSVASVHINQAADGAQEPARELAQESGFF
jgi:hypothetical protein